MTSAISTGTRATRRAEAAQPIEQELVAFVRRTARWLDPEFPASGHRGPSQRGQWTDDDGVNVVQEVDELDPQGRGVRSVRTMIVGPSGGPHKSRLHLVALGLASDAQLELDWDFTTSDDGLRGISAELTVRGPGEERCVAAFHDWFDVAY